MTAATSGIVLGAGTEGEAILRQLRERIVRFAASRLSRDVAEDLAQDTLVLLTTKYATVTSIEDLVPLALRIVRFKIIEFRRKAGRRGELARPPAEGEDPIAQLADDKSWGPEIQMQRRELADRLAEALRQLTGRCRTLFRLKLEGHKFADIQRLLGARTINTVYTWDLRCRERLLALMGGSWQR
jgi:RNA polymerase sigma-70 factor, ECF subfamily